MKLQANHIQALREIDGGATIFDFFLAKDLREVQKVDTELLTIVDNMNELSKITGITYNGVERLPYFGAILTQKGKDVIYK
ncbi:hypothetical protein [Bacillus cereus group sp. BfR-BA-01328]|uniref:hypothetical protein n=1 Tax=Bacillus cereus group sp. BfR-BA-01328 TaxID=2920304 RepID=UPI001F58A584